jgi:tRNA 2-thiouridine synthesizing protein A
MFLSIKGRYVMDDNELRELQVDKMIDARGMACPGPLLEAKKSMADVPDNGILEVLSSDEGTNNDIPMWSKKMKYEVLGILEEAGFWHLYVKKTV